MYNMYCIYNIILQIFISYHYQYGILNLNNQKHSRLALACFGVATPKAHVDHGAGPSEMVNARLFVWDVAQCGAPVMFVGL